MCWGGFYGLVKAIDFFKAPLVFNFPPHTKSSASRLLLVELGLEKALHTHLNPNAPYFLRRKIVLLSAPFKLDDFLRANFEFYMHSWYKTTP
jgi:hypothetical protein